MNKESIMQAASYLTEGSRRIRADQDNINGIMRRTPPDSGLTGCEMVDLLIQWRQAMASLLISLAETIEYCEGEIEEFEKEFPEGDEDRVNFINSKYDDVEAIRKTKLFAQLLIDATLDYIG